MRYLAGMVVTMLALLVAPAFPYEHYYSKGGKPAKWESSEFTLSISVSLFDDRNDFGSREQVLSIMERSIARWNRASGIQISLKVSRDLSVSAEGSSGDGVSLLTIAQTPENLLLFAGDRAGNAAFTRLFFDDDGRIKEADIVLNPIFSFSTNSNPDHFDLESTIVHEIGHAIGLGHSSVIGASMNPETGKHGLFGIPFSELRTLASDDQVGSRALYGPPADAKDCCGSLAGRVDQPGKAVNASVWIEDTETGAVGAAVSTDARGNYLIEGIREGKYRVFSRLNAETGVAELGVFESVSDKTASISGGRFFGSLANGLRYAGINGQLSTLPLPLHRDDVFKIYVAGGRYVDPSELRLSSPGLRIVPGSFEKLNYGGGVKAVSFLVEVAEKVPDGDYSVYIVGEQGILDVLVGVISVSGEGSDWPVTRLE